MDTEDLKHQINNLIDRWSSEQKPNTRVSDSNEPSTAVPEKRELPKDKRVVRTKQSGDRVYLLDEVKKTRQWISNPEVLDSLGFVMEDVTDVDDSDLIKYQMGPALYRVENGTA